MIQFDVCFFFKWECETNYIDIYIYIDILCLFFGSDTTLKTSHAVLGAEAVAASFLPGVSWLQVGPREFGKLYFREARVELVLHHSGLRALRR